MNYYLRNQLRSFLIAMQNCFCKNKKKYIYIIPFKMIVILEFNDLLYREHRASSSMSRERESKERKMWSDETKDVVNFSFLSFIYVIKKKIRKEKLYTFHIIYAYFHSPKNTFYFQ